MRQFLSVKNIIVVVYSLVIFFAAAWSLKKPAYNWDILPYMGVILSYEKGDALTNHSIVYAIAKEQIPAEYYNRLIDSSSVYRSRVAHSAAIYRSQFPFYLVKPLYTGTAYLFYKAGASLARATVWPSVIAYFFMGLLLFFWLKKYWGSACACAGSMCIMLSPPLLNEAALSTPDALSGLLVFAAVYFLAEKKSLPGACLFLGLSVLARLDNIIPAICLLVATIGTNKWRKEIPVKPAVFSLVGLLLLYFAVSHNTTSFGWSVLFYPAFAKQLNLSYTVHDAFVFEDYVSLAKSQLLTGLYFSFISLFFFLVVFLLWNFRPFSFDKLDAEQTLALVFVVTIAIRFVLQPLVADRLYIPYYLSVWAFLVKKHAAIISKQQLLQT